MNIFKKQKILLLWIHCQQNGQFYVYAHILTYNKRHSDSKMFKQRENDDKACCPFNKNHVFSKEKLIFHLNRCKDREKVAHQFTTCRYNGLHFIKHDEAEMHEMLCPDKAEVRRMMDFMRRNYEDINRERERSREKKKLESREREKQCDEDDDEHTLSECDECLEVIKNLDLKKYPKLEKYLQKYEQIKRSECKE